jgi:hypothetical protein
MPAQMIESSLSSYATKVNFIIHNIAQLSSFSSSGNLYTFYDKVATPESDGQASLGTCTFFDINHRLDLVCEDHRL